MKAAGTPAEPAAPAPARPRLSHRKKLAYTAVLLALLALAAEGGLRLADPAIFRFALAARRSHAYREWSRSDLVPDVEERLRLERADGTVIYDFTLATDALGLRSAARSGRPEAAHEGRPRAAVHCVGDSFTLGWGVEAGHSYPARLQERLGAGFLVLNEGVDGIGLVAARERHRAAARAYPPAWVLYLFVANDVAEDAQAEGMRGRWGLRHAWERGYAAARRHSYLLNVPFVLKWDLGLRPRLNRPLGEDRAEFGELPDLADWMASARAAAPAQHATARALLELRDACRAVGAELRVLFVHADAESHAMARLCLDHGIPIVAEMIPYEQRIPWDWHLNPEGNRRLAEAVAERVFGLPPP